MCAPLSPIAANSRPIFFPPACHYGKCRVRSSSSSSSPVRMHHFLAAVKRRSEHFYIKANATAMMVLIQSGCEIGRGENGETQLFLALFTRCEARPGVRASLCSGVTTPYVNMNPLCCCLFWSRQTLAGALASYLLISDGHGRRDGVHLCSTVSDVHFSIQRISSSSSSFMTTFPSREFFFLFFLVLLIYLLAFPVSYEQITTTLDNVTGENWMLFLS